jgi:nucleotide-binding universal stress UspA family protein
MQPILIAYDASPNAEDALLLARQLHELTGAPLAVATVHRADPRVARPSATVHGREEFLRRESLRLLARAQRTLGVQGAEIHALAGSTTAGALSEFAQRRHPLVIVFGSAYNAPPAHVHPGSAARRLLQSAPCAIAFAPAGYRRQAPERIGRVAFAHEDDQDSARRSAQLLVEHAGAGAEIVEERPELLVIASRPSGIRGRLALSAGPQQALQSARVPVVVLPYGSPLAIGQGATVARAA